MSKVCVIMTVHDTRLGYVAASLTSLCFQTFEDFSVLVIDDASEKEDYSWMYKPVKLKTDREPLNLRLMRNEVNLGLCRSVNLALTLIPDDCEYVIRLGSDDLFHCNLLKDEVEFLDKHPDYIACCCNLQTFGTKEKIIRRDKEFTWNCNIRSKAHSYGYAGGMMFRKSALKHCLIDENLKMCEDFDFHLQLLKLGKIRTIQDFPMYLYRQHENNLCKQVKNSERLEYLDYIYRKHEVNKDLISIIMPVYNVDTAFITECLESIRKQTYQNFEIIIYNDGSSIDYKQLPIFRKMQNVIKYYRNDTNLGIPYTLNLATDRAKGDYLVRIDADDIVDEEFLETEHRFLEENKEYIACCCELRRFGCITGNIKRPVVFDINTIHDIKSAHGYGYGCSFMFRRKALESCRFDLDFPVCEDFDFTLQLMKVGKIKALEPMYNYRQHMTSTIKQYNNKQRFELINRILDKHKLV